MAKEKRTPRRWKNEEAIAAEETELREQGTVGEDGSLVEDPTTKAGATNGAGSGAEAPKANGNGSAGIDELDNLDFITRGKKKDGPPWYKRWAEAIVAFFSLMDSFFVALWIRVRLGLRYVGLSLQGGMAHLYPKCSETCLWHRSGLGWMVVMGASFDAALMYFGWRSIISDKSILLVSAIIWGMIIIFIDRYLLRTMDGTRTPSKLVLGVRLIVLIVMIGFNVLLLTVSLLGSSVDKRITEKNNAVIANINAQIAAAQDEFERWKDQQLKYQTGLSINLENLRKDCIAEASGKGGWTGKRGVGPTTNACMQELRNSEETIKGIKAEYNQEMLRRKNAFEEKKSLLLSQRDQTGKQQAIADGFVGRIFNSFEVADEMFSKQPYLRYVMYAGDILLICLLLIPLVQKFRKEIDEYDILFENSLYGRVTVIQNQADELKKQQNAENEEQKARDKKAEGENELKTLEDTLRMKREKIQLQGSIDDLEVERLLREKLIKDIKAAIDKGDLDTVRKLRAELNVLSADSTVADPDLSTPDPEPPKPPIDDADAGSKKTV